jgi:hypothetical protein
MSNLSELLPAGAGAKSASFVASGTLASGVTVALKTDGTVEAVVETSQSQTLGTPAVFNPALSDFTVVAFDSTNNKMVIAYQDGGNSTQGMAVVATVSGTSISFGSEVVFETGTPNKIAATFDSTNSKVVIAYNNNNSSAKAVVGTVSGTSISFGTPVTFLSVLTRGVAATYDPINNKVVIIYNDSSNNNYCTGIVGTVSGTSISFGTGTSINNTILNDVSVGIAFDSTSNKVVVAWRGTSNYPNAVVGTVSGTSISFGTANVFKSQAIAGSGLAVVYDTTNNKTVVAVQVEQPLGKGSVFVGTVSGTSISFGTELVFTGNYVYIESGAYDTLAKKVVIVYRDGSNSGRQTIVIGTVSGTSISFETPVVNGTGAAYYSKIAYDSTNSKMVLAYRDAGNSEYGTSVVFQNDSIATNNTDFVGITDEAIANTASGSVIVQGGVGTGVVVPLAPVFGAESVFNTAIYYTTATYDSTNNKVIIAYRDDGNSNYGTAIVGTVSGTSISFGTAVVFDSGNTNTFSSTYDSTNNKVVIAYRSGNNSNYGAAVVGTVSGTSITFGTIAIFESALTAYHTATYDSTNNKVVIAYQDQGNSSYGTAIVGTVSGTSISFGAAAVFNSTSTLWNSATFESATNKIVIAYRNAGNNGYGTSIVGTVSSTSISFGTAVVFESAASEEMQAVFDANANKIVIAYHDAGNSFYGTTIVGTLSGTSISFGTPVVFNAGNTIFIAATFNSTNNKVVIAYRDRGNSEYGTAIAGTVSGTSISFGAETVFNTATTDTISVCFDSTNNKVAIAYSDAGNSYYGTAIVANLTSALTIGTDYFVQADGTLSTTSSTVPAGRALTTSSILLEG